MANLKLEQLPAWVAPFLLHLRTSGIVSRSARECGIAPGTISRLREQSFDFDEAIEDAIEEAVDALEAEAWRRARDGVTEPVYYQGSRVGDVQKYSDGLIQFLLKGRRRSVYGDKQEITGADGGPLQLDDTARAARVASLLELAKQRQLLASDQAGDHDPSTAPAPDAGENDPAAGLY